MKKIISLLFNQWTAAILCLLIIALIIYFIGPLVAIGNWHPWQLVISRWITILLVVLFWLILKLSKLVRLKSNSKKLMDGLLGREQDTHIAAEEVATLRAKFDHALKLLHHSSRKLGRKFSLYELPWYIIIGPPGSGKTTALINSGLKFPLSGDERANAVAGVGGTRYCDWWFTDEAVLLDTAGRYTTQDSQRDLDKGAWLGFLLLLKRFRKRQPINGAFVAISVSDLLMQNDRQREEHVLSISQRLHELRDNLRIEFPVYVMLTKCDLIAGFDEFFDRFSPADREQIWGLTLSVEEGRVSEVRRAIRNSFNELIDRVNRQVLYRLHSERDQSRARKITAFPKQLQQLQTILVDFVGAIFDQNRYNHPTLLRGVYLTSATQEGTPIDRLMNKLSGGRPFHTSSQGKSFFLKHLFEKLVFAESGIAGVDTNLERRLYIMRSSVVFVILGFTAILIAGMTLSYLKNTALLENVSDTISEAEMVVENISASEVDPLTILPVLNQLRNIPTGYQQRLEDDVPFSLRFGLYQGKRIGDQAENAYRRILKKALLSRLMLETESRMGDMTNESSYRYAALRIYLMLESDEHYNADEVMTFYQYDLLSRNRRQLTGEQIEQFNQHFEVLFAQRPLPLPMQLDLDLVRDVRVFLRDVTPEEVALGRMEKLRFEDLLPFSILDNADKSLIEQAFTRKSGAPLSEGVPALYTKSAYQRLAKGPELEELVDEVIEESWIFDQEDFRPAINKENLLQNVHDAYLERYANAYLTLLQDLQLAPFNSYGEGAQLLNALSDPEDSPLVSVLQAVKEQTLLTGDVQEIVTATDDLASKAQDRLARILGNDIAADITQGISLPKDFVTERFTTLHELVAVSGEPQTRALQRVLDLFGELYRFMAKAAVEASGPSLNPEVAAAGQAAVNQTRIEAASTQENILVKPLLEDAAQMVSGLAFGGVISHINSEWQRDVREFCENSIAERYPFVDSSRAEVALRDFEDFFGYGGLMDEFFKTHLEEFVDTSVSPWRINPQQSDVIRLSSEALRAFENAYYVRRAFFNRDSKEVDITFTLTPRELDSGLRGFYLDIEGQSVNYEFGPLAPTDVSWPGVNPGSGVQMSMRMENGDLVELHEDGEWALFRILDKSAIQRSPSPELLTLTFKVSGFDAQYNLATTGIYNPFNSLRSINFICPGRI